MKTEEIKSKGTIAVCTIMRENVAHREYINSVLLLSDLLRSEGYSMALYTIGGEELTAGSKNFLVNNALKTENLLGVLFLDANLGVNPQDILSMIESGKDVIGGLVPKKSLNWQSIKNAVVLKKDNLQLYSGIFPIKLKENSDITIEYGSPFEVRHLDSSIMYVSSDVFQKLEPLCEKYLENPLNNSQVNSEIVEYFKTSILKENKELLSEDHFFCELWGSAGGSVWVAPWVECSQSGVFTYEGRFLHSVELLSDIKDLTMQ